MTPVVRAQRGADRPEVRRVVAEAFGDDGLHIVELLGALDASAATRADLVAEVDGAVVGHVRLSRCWVDAREALVSVLVLSPLSVAPSAQGRGVGTALLAGAVEAARASGAPAVFLEGSPDFYGARGWERGSAHGFVRPSVRIPDAAFQVVVLDAHEPWMTGALVYCDAFWALDAAGLRDPLLAQLGE